LSALSPRYRTVRFSLVLLFIPLLALAACMRPTAEKPRAAATSTRTIAPPQQQIEQQEVGCNPQLIGARWQTEAYDLRSVVGDIRNNSPRTCTNVEVEVTFFDKRGTHLGTLSANTPEIQPWTTWTFKIFVPSFEADTFKVTRISGT
jgi:hypothetical protein